MKNEKYELEVFNLDDGSGLGLPDDIKTMIRLVQRSQDRGFYALGYMTSKDDIETVEQNPKQYLDIILKNIRTNTDVKIYLT